MAKMIRLWDVVGTQIVSKNGACSLWYIINAPSEKDKTNKPQKQKGDLVFTKPQFWVNCK